MLNADVLEMNAPEVVMISLLEDMAAQKNDTPDELLEPAATVGVVEVAKKLVG